MSRRYSIGFFIGILLIVFLFIFGFRFSYTRARNHHTEQNTAETTVTGYWVKEEDGYVIVYMGDEKRVYEYTSIWTEDLPDDVQDELDEGIYMEHQSEVYSFLENYSS